MSEPSFLLLLRASLDIEPAQRAKFIHAQCTDTDLRAALFSALEAAVAVAADTDSRNTDTTDPGCDAPALQPRLAGNAQPGAQLQQALQQVPNDTARYQHKLAGRLLQERAGQTLGAYRLLRRLGAGGMGEVWLAERIDGFAQQVAIKWAHPSKLSSASVARFDLERQLVASLDHPGIARVLDGGLEQRSFADARTADAGALWFAMDYVDGLALDRFVAHNRPDLAARLALMGQLCDAVHYAHQRLVVHRDLKPSNVLIDRHGRVRLIDFGIAKRLDVDTQLTESVLPMSYSYAAPEQIRGEPISTATDVHALGGILYELLTGARPHEATGNSALAMMQAITEQDPRPPSVRARSNDGSGVRRVLLSGDLDTITLKALARDPARRYGSVQAFQDDISSYLRGLPIAARADSVHYRVGKLIRRNRWVSALTASLLIAVISSSVIFARQAAVNARATERALAEARQAESVVTHMANVLNLAQSQGESVPTVKLFEWAADAKLSGEYGDPAINLALQIAISDVLVMRGDYTRALALTDAIGPQLAQASARDALHVALNRARALIGTGQLDLAQRALADAKPLVQTPANLAAAQWALYRGELLRAQGDTDAAVKAGLDAAALIERASDVSALDHGVMLASIAATLLQSGQLDEAGRLAKRALAAWDQGKVAATSARATTRMISANAAYLRGQLQVVLHEIDAIAPTGNIEAPGAIAARKVTYAKALVLTGQTERGLALAQIARASMCASTTPTLDCIRQTISLLDTSMVANDLDGAERYLTIAAQALAVAPNPVLEANLKLLQLRWTVLRTPSDASVSAWLQQLAATPPTGLSLRSTVRVLLVSAQQLDQQGHGAFAGRLASTAIALAAQLPPETGGMDRSLLQLWRGRIAKTPPSAEVLLELSRTLGSSHPWLTGWQIAAMPSSASQKR
jgi:serine/threonine protein kinase